MMRKTFAPSAEVPRSIHRSRARREDQAAGPSDPCIPDAGMRRGPGFLLPMPSGWVQSSNLPDPAMSNSYKTTSLLWSRSGKDFRPIWAPLPTKSLFWDDVLTPYLAHVFCCSSSQGQPTIGSQKANPFFSKQRNKLNTLVLRAAGSDWRSGWVQEPRLQSQF